MFSFRKRYRRVGIALSGGAVRGMAHIGVLMALSRAGIPVDIVSGTSAGALVGAYVAGGIPVSRMRAVARTMTWAKISSVRMPGLGILSSRRMKSFLGTTLGIEQIEDLKLPYAAVAVGLARGECRAFSSGPLAEAVMASTAIPGVFAPVEIDGELYVDGGLRSFDPVAEARELGADYVIASRLTPPRAWGRHPKSIVEVMLASFDLALGHIAEGEPKADAAIVPNMDNTNLYDFSQRDDLVDRGLRAAEAVIPKIKRDLRL